MRRAHGAWGLTPFPAFARGVCPLLYGDRHRRGGRELERVKLREDVERIGTRYDVSQRASGNQGHVFGTDLSDKDKDALVEYLKAL